MAVEEALSLIEKFEDAQGRLEFVVAHQGVIRLMPTTWRVLMEWVVENM